MKPLALLLALLLAGCTTEPRLYYVVSGESECELWYWDMTDSMPSVRIYSALSGELLREITFVMPGLRL